MQETLSTRTFDAKFVTATFLIIGTSIGAGMLGLPVQTAQGGFLPAIFLFLLTWFITITSGVLFTEVILNHPPGSNYISLGRKILGEKFTFLIFGFYILLFYSLIAAYTKGIGVILSQDLSLTPSSWTGSLLFLALLLPVMCFGTKIIGRVNGLLIFLLLASFFLLVSIGTQNTTTTFMSHQNWFTSLFSLPLMIGSFGFHGTLPSLIDFLDRDRKKIHWSIFIGSTLTLLIYLSWEFLILGSIPLTGEISLTSALQNDQTAITPMSQLSHNPHIWSLAHLFSLTAIITSFFGVSIGLIDFLIDAFKLHNTPLTKTILLTSIYFSVLLLSLTELRIFYLSLNYGAGLAAIFLLIFLPAYLAYRSPEPDLAPPLFAKKRTIPLVFLFSALSLLSCLLSFILSH
jgi:tyrosine-specific transport protein